MFIVFIQTSLGVYELLFLFILLDNQNFYQLLFPAYGKPDFLQRYDNARAEGIFLRLHVLVLLVVKLWSA